MTAWLIISLLILVNAFFVAAEFATVGVRQSRISQMASEGNWSAVRLLPVLTDAGRLDRYIAACQIGITLSSLVLGAYSQATLASELGPLLAQLGPAGAAAAEPAAALVVLIAMTGAQVIVGELVPKSLALQYTTQTALLLVVPMQASMRLFAPFIALLNGSGQALLRLAGMDAVPHRHVHSPEEIDLLMVDSRDGGLLEPDEHLRLHRALRLSVRTAHELMVPRIHLQAIDLETPADEALRAVAASPYTRLPVYRATLDDVVGILHTKDLARHVKRAGPQPPIEAIMRPVAAVPESLPADRLLAAMRAQRTHQLLVLDQHGGLAGLVTLEDVLAEMLGDLDDELKGGQPRPERLPDGRVRLPGLLRADEAAEWLGAWWTGDATTVGGLVAHTVGRLPRVGDRVTIAGIEVEVEVMAGRAVASILATPARRQEDDHG